MAVGGLMAGWSEVVEKPRPYTNLGNARKTRIWSRLPSHPNPSWSIRLLTRPPAGQRLLTSGPSQASDDDMGLWATCRTTYREVALACYQANALCCIRLMDLYHFLEELITS